MPDKKTTPGIYIEEANAFPSSAVAVETSVPVFIGYTEIAQNGDNILVNKPTRITSLAEYETYFGTDYRPSFRIEVAEAEAEAESFSLDGKSYRLNYSLTQQFYLYNSLRLFYANGGSACYVHCLNTYGDKPQGFKRSADEFINALDVLKKEPEITLIVMPDATTVDEEYTGVYTAVLRHCSQMQTCFAILDLFRQTPGDTLDKHIADFRSGIGTDNLKYGAAYYPWLNTTIVQPAAVDFENIELADISYLIAYLPEPEVKELMNPQNKVYAALLPVLKSQRTPTTANYTEVEKSNFKQVKTAFHQSLKNASPTYNKIVDQIRFRMNHLPPGGAIAGMYAYLDSTRGVWKSPANVSLNMVTSPVVNITQNQQEQLNIDSLEGKSINAIRTFPGEGNLVWGARTLDGNSQDWRYINVRRTITMIEQSTKLATMAFVFEPNDPNTWVTVKSMIQNFLLNLWQQGALAGSTPEDAYSVDIGLGSTMTANDILNGLMNVSIKVAIVRPAEFIMITLQQKMQQS